MAFKKSFVVSTEAVNQFGFWVKTDGINLDNAKNNCPCFYDHRTWDVPLGHWENFRVVNNELIADLIIEGSNEREKDYITKIENGDIKGASIGADPIRWNDSPLQIKPGQIVPTAEAVDLYEISLTPLPANKNALALKFEGNLITLNNTNVNILPTLNNNNMKQIALKLGLAETATETEIVQAIGALQLSSQQGTAFKEGILKVADEGLSEEQKEIFKTLSLSNPTQALKFASSCKASTTGSEKEEEQSENGLKLKKDVKLSELIKKGTSDNKEDADAKKTYDYLQRFNKVELTRIQKEEPNKYKELAKAYEEGVRYKG